MKNSLLRYRLKALMTQQELAGKSGVSRRTIVNIERGLHKPTGLVRYKLARIFQVEPEDIFPEESEEE